MFCPELEAIGTVISTLAVLFTAIIAFLGLRYWQKEMQRRAEYEATRQIIRSTYRLARELNASRSP
jgi:Tfp pilus assembly protein PilO